MNPLRQTYQMTNEHLARFRLSEARIEAMKLSPGHYSRAEIEEAFIANWHLRGELVEAHGIDDGRFWVPSPTTGLIHVGKDYEPGE